ncbi:MAG: serine/threonine-protein kinase [Planctomycetota bacterium]
MDDKEDQRAADQGSRIGDFTLLGRIGGGGQGEVYEARQESLGRSVALKVFSSEFTLSEERVQRFRREAAAGGRLAHPNIVAVHAVGEEGGVHYIAQELVEGGRTLADRIDEVRRLPELPRDWYERVAELFVQVADGLHSAHEAGIIHRDVKPGNVLLTRDERPKIADFGLALVEDDLLRSRSGALLGTPVYMSPEQVIGRRRGIDRRTDIFSLGTSLYEALTLRRPFEGDSREHIIQAIVLHEPADPRKLHGRIPRDLAVICMKALEKRPERRYASAADFAADLRRHLASEPILARPPGPALRALKWGRRHPVLSGVGSVGIASLVIVIALMVQKDEALRQAQEESDQATILLGTLTAQLGSFDPSRGAQDPEYGRRFLDLAVEAVGALSSRKDRQADLLFNLAFAYRNRVAYEQALLLFERSLALRRTAFGDDDLRTTRAMFFLASTLRLVGREQEARAMLEDVRARLDTLEHPPGPLLAGSRAELGLVFVGEGRLAEAEALLRRALATEIRPDEEHFDVDFTPMIELHLGSVLMKSGRIAEAEELIERTRAWSIESGTEFQRMWAMEFTGELRVLQAAAAHASGDEVGAAARLAEAETLYVAARESAERVFGRQHVDYAKVTSNLGVLYRRQGRLDEARPLLEEALDVLEALRAPDDFELLYLRNNLGTLAFSQGRTADAEAAWRAIAEGPRANEDIEPVLTALANLVKLLARERRFEEALPLARALYQRTPAEDLRREERRKILEQMESFTEVVTQDP